MAKLPDQTLSRIFYLQRRLVELINEAKATEFVLLERFGENEATLPELDQMHNSVERLTVPYSRLHTLALRIAEYQPIATDAMLNLLAQTIEQAEVLIGAVEASIAETKLALEFTMNQPTQIPDPQTRARSVRKWREVNQQIDLLTLQLDELIAMVETGLRSQRLARLQSKSKSQVVEKIN